MFNTSFKNLTFLFIGSIVWCGRENGRNFAIIPKGNRVIESDVSSLRLLKENIVTVWKNKYKKMILYSGCLAVIVGCFCGMNKEMPKGYIVPRKQVDIESEETWYLNAPDDTEYEGMKIMDYTDSKTKMQVLQGNIVVVERVRTCISAISVIWITVMGIWLVYYVCRQYRINSK